MADTVEQWAVGFRVKSGHAVAVVLRGSARSPVAVARRVIDLCDPALGHTRQPYHSARGEAEEDAAAIAGRIAVIERAAARSVRALLDEMPVPPGGAAIVVGSVIDPSMVANPHIRAHAHEGRLFRTVLQNALSASGIDCSVVVEKALAETSRAALHRTDGEISGTLEAFGRSMGKPWRADEKSAATAAWMRLPGEP